MCQIQVCPVKICNFRKHCLEHKRNISILRQRNFKPVAKKHTSSLANVLTVEMKAHEQFRNKQSKSQNCSSSGVSWKDFEIRCNFKSFIGYEGIGIGEFYAVHHAFQKDTETLKFQTAKKFLENKNSKHSTKFSPRINYALKHCSNNLFEWSEIMHGFSQYLNRE